MKDRYINLEIKKPSRKDKVKHKIFCIGHNAETETYVVYQEWDKDAGWIKGKYCMDCKKAIYKGIERLEKCKILCGNKPVTETTKHHKECAYAY